MNETHDSPEAHARFGARIRGASLRPVILWHVAQQGQERAAHLLEHVPPPYRHLFDAASPDLGVHDATWYPAPALHGLIDGMLHGQPPASRPDFIVDSAQVAVQATRQGAYRWMFDTLMTPDRYVQHAQALFNRYYEGGVMIKTETEPGTHLSVLSAWGGHHPFLCEILAWSSVTIYQAMGCRNVRGQRVSCVSAGAADCRWTVSWDL